MKLIWLEDFLTLIEAGTFSKAAQRRHVTQPAFSRRIAMLEHWLGVQLIDRRFRGAEPTPTAARFEPELRRLLAMTYELRNHMRAEALAQTKITLTMQHTLMITHLPQLLGRLQAEHPGSTFRVRTGNFDQCVTQLSCGEADLLLCFEMVGGLATAHPAEIERLHIGQETLLPVATPGHGAHLLRKPDEDLLVKLINYPEESFLGRAVRRDCLPGLIKNHTTETVCESAFTAGIKEMVLAGRGIAWLPQSLVQQELVDGKLISLQDALASSSLGIAIYRNAQSPHALIDALWSIFNKYGRHFFTQAPHADTDAEAVCLETTGKTQDLTLESSRNGGDQ
jgi:DNA-binding transcriptional LysR family regulator